MNDKVVVIRNCLDNGTDFPSGLSPHSFVDAIITFLSSLSKPLIPVELYPNVIFIVTISINILLQKE